MIQLLFDKRAWIGFSAVLLFIAGFYVGQKMKANELTSYKLQIAQKATEQRNRLDAATDYAKQKEAERIAENTKIMNSLKEQIRELENEADKDPDANRSALSPSSVMRINKVSPRSNKTDSR